MSIQARLRWVDRVAGITYQPGQEIPATHPKMDWLLRSRIVVDMDATPAEPDPDPAPKDETPEVSAPRPRNTMKRPNKAAKLAAWQDYARSQGVDPKKMTREELIARFT